MREKKYTPGPWIQHQTHRCSNDTWYVITEADGYGPVFEVGGKDKNGQIAEAKYLVTDKSEIQANAHLIAAAPELLEALEGLMAIIMLETIGDSVTDIERAEKAIAKAYGEAS